MMKKMALLWIAAGVLLWGQKISKIEYIGLAHLSPSVAEEISGIHKGDQMDITRINKSVKKFFALGYFKDVWVESKGRRLIYHFKEKVAIANLEVEGFGSEEDTEKLLETIGLKKGDLYDVRRLQKAKTAIIENLEAQGYYDSVVEVTTEDVGSSSISVKFDVNKGEKIIIRRINFIGLETMDQDELQSLMANKQRDALGWFPIGFHDGVAKVDQLELDGFRAKEIFMQNGYLDAVVGKPLMRVDFGSYNATIDYKVEEGVQYKVGKVSLVQSVKGIDSEEILDDLRLKEGKQFDVELMRKDMQSIKNSVGDLGYAFAKVFPNMNKNPKDQVINLQYVVQEGSTVSINDVLISGNDITKDRVIRRYIYLAPGDQYSETDLKESKSALGRTGYFEKIDIETQRVSADKINLLVKVQEASTGTISAGGGYGQYEGLMLNASVSDKNVFGSGINASLGFDISKISTNYNLSFSNPRVWDSTYRLDVSLFKSDYEYIDYKQDQLGGNVNIGKLLTRHLYTSVGVGYVDNQSKISSDYNTTLTSIFYNDRYNKTSGFLSFKYDSTDDYYVPREGYIASANMELASMNGDVTTDNQTLGYSKFADFVKFTGKFGAYYGMDKILNYDLVLRYKARYAALSSTDDYIPIGEKLFMGGMGSVRGYDPYSISPTESGSRVGGTQSFSNTIEASIPLSEATKMRLAFFLDYGVIGSDPILTTNGKVTPGNVARSSGGAVIEWQSPFGPINLIFADAINPKDGDYTSFFEFSMGTKF